MSGVMSVIQAVGPSQYNTGPHHKPPSECSSPSFSRGYEKQNSCMETAITSLDNLSSQILQFVYSPDATHVRENELTAADRDKLKASMTLMRSLLVQAQTKFKKMVDDNRRLAGRIDSSIQEANREVSALRAELTDTSQKLRQMAPLPPSTEMVQHKALSDSTAQLRELTVLREENARLRGEIRVLQQELADIRGQNGVMATDENKASSYKLDLLQSQQELNRAREALQAMKADRKRLKAEKLELLGQLKQLYCTLEDKEAELRDFIRNYELRMRESDDALKQLAEEKEANERVRWESHKHSEDLTDQNTELQQQLEERDKLVSRLQAQLAEANERLKSQGISTIKSTTSSSSADSMLKSASPPSSEDTGYQDSSTVDIIPIDAAQCDVTSAEPPCSARSMKSSASILSGSSGYHGSLENLRSAVTRGDSLVNVCPSSSIANQPVHMRHAGSRSANVTSSQFTVLQGIQDLQTQSTALQQDPSSQLRRLSSAAISQQDMESSSASSIMSSIASTPRPNNDCVIISDVKLTRSNKKRSKSPGAFTRIFGKSRSRRSLAITDKEAMEVQAELAVSQRLSLVSQENYQEKLSVLEQCARVPMAQWRAGHVLAWMEINMNMPLYGKVCAENIKSGKVLLGLSDSELDSALDLKSPLHRRKLRLAIEEHRDPSIIKYGKAGSLDHTWVAHRWLSDLGLAQYRASLESHLVDGRLLNVLTRKDLERHLGINRKFHQISLLHGIELLRRVSFNKEVLHERRSQCDHEDCDPLVWTNQRLLKWLQDIDLHEYSMALNESGLHGAVLVLEPSFTSESLANLLGIAPNKSYVRRHLATEYEALVRPARAALETPIAHSKKRASGSVGRESGRSMQRSYRGGAGASQESETPTKRLSFRGSFSRALGKKVKESMDYSDNNKSGVSGAGSPTAAEKQPENQSNHSTPKSAPSRVTGTTV